MHSPRPTGWTLGSPNHRAVVWRREEASADSRNINAAFAQQRQVTRVARWFVAHYVGLPSRTMEDPGARAAAERLVAPRYELAALDALVGRAGPGRHRAGFVSDGSCSESTLPHIANSAGRRTSRARHSGSAAVIAARRPHAVVGNRWANRSRSRRPIGDPDVRSPGYCDFK